MVVEKKRKEINGEEFEVGIESGVDDGVKYRRVYMLHVETAEEKGHSYMCADVTYYDRDKLLKVFGSGSDIPPLEDHLREVVNDGCAVFFGRKEEEERLRGKIEDVMSAAEDVYGEE